MATIYFHISVSINGYVKCTITEPNTWEDDDRKSNASFVPYYLRNSSIDDDIYEHYLPRTSLIDFVDLSPKKYTINYNNEKEDEEKDDKSDDDNEYNEYEDYKKNDIDDDLDNTYDDESSDDELDYVLDPV